MPKLATYVAAAAIEKATAVAAPPRKRVKLNAIMTSLLFLWAERSALRCVRLASSLGR